MHKINNTLKILDVTLRDGGFRNHFNFSNDTIKTVITTLDKAGIDYIEIGYRNGLIKPTSNLGKTAHCEQDFLLSCKSLVTKSKIAVMVYPKNVQLNDIQELKACGVTLLRVCIPQGQYEAARPIIEAGKQSGLEVGVNFTYMSHYTAAAMDAEVAKISQLNPDVIYFADSNGSMLPTDIATIYEKYITEYPTIPFGLHAHDNLGLAQSNCIAALQAGAQYIDVSLSGMGKGIGNLKAEFFTAWLHALGIKKYGLEEILAATNHIRTLETMREGIDIEDFKLALSDIQKNLSK